MTNLTEVQKEDNQEFLVGDAVISLDNQFPLYDDIHHLIAVYGDQVWIQTNIGMWTINKKFVRHAQFAEIQSSHRLTDPDDIDDIEYHISPNCKVIHFDSWDEALHFHRAFHAQKEVP